MPARAWHVFRLQRPGLGAGGACRSSSRRSAASSWSSPGPAVPGRAVPRPARGSGRRGEPTGSQRRFMAPKTVPAPLNGFALWVSLMIGAYRDQLRLPDRAAGRAPGCTSVPAVYVGIRSHEHAVHRQAPQHPRGRVDRGTVPLVTALFGLIILPYAQPRPEARRHLGRDLQCRRHRPQCAGGRSRGAGLPDIDRRHDLDDAGKARSRDRSAAAPPSPTNARSATGRPASAAPTPLTSAGNMRTRSTSNCSTSSPAPG